MAILRVGQPTLVSGVRNVLFQELEMFSMMYEADDFKIFDVAKCG